MLSQASILVEKICGITRRNRSTWAPRFNIQGKHNTAMYLYCFYYSGDFNKGTCSGSVIF
ncbi:hypothetical protein CFI09_25625 (plasmid) [Escherichia coli]|nr:hypothetical protein CFI09_25625 [Escherichia coli]